MSGSIRSFLAIILVMFSESLSAEVPAFFFQLNEDGDPQVLNSPVRFPLISQFITNELLEVTDSSYSDESGEITASFNSSFEYRSFAGETVQELSVSINGSELAAIDQFEAVAEKTSFQLEGIGLTEGNNTVSIFVDGSSEGMAVFIMWAVVVEAKTNDEFEVESVSVETPELVTSCSPPDQLCTYGIAFRTEADLTGFSCQIDGMQPEFRLRRLNNGIYILIDPYSEGKPMLFRMRPTRNPSVSFPSNGLKASNVINKRYAGALDQYAAGFCLGMAARGIEMFFDYENVSSVQKVDLEAGEVEIRASFRPPSGGIKELSLSSSLIPQGAFFPSEAGSISDLGSLYATLTSTAEEENDSDIVLALLLNDFSEFGFSSSFPGPYEEIIQLSAELFEFCNEETNEGTLIEKGMFWGAIMAECYRVTQNPRDSGIILGVSAKSQFLGKVAPRLSK